ncbi:tyrosine-protein phosphatase [Zhihengliuella flava]|uniref:Protein-tyrosine phosphatase n=1 Tax=Zhihengliuella flava TaxID=1285193 RepID=A0A931DCU8_9MICC|nr:tyrosine-protein phosphatase [Zhihengliuella flava]MBG6085106.1 protein-tyrosine phosphatase [Zhihengliuella flava]
MTDTTSTTASAPAFTPLVNLRDLGGTPVAGGHLKHGLLWRADDIALSPADELADLAECGLRAVIDLRSPAELAATGGPALTARLSAEHGISHHHLPFTQDVADPQALAEVMRQTDSVAGVGRWYAALLRDRATDVVAALRLVAETDGGVLFHCAAGKDRTGVLAASILSVLGAERDAIVADYAATGAAMTAIMGRLTSGNHAAVESSAIARHQLPPADHPMMGAHADSMEAMLEDLDRDGGLPHILEAAGLDAELTAALRQKLVG